MSAPTTLLVICVSPDMRLLYLHQYFTTPTMSGGTRSYEIARRLVAKGHDVHMIASMRDEVQRPRAGWFETDEAGIKVHWLPVPYSNRMASSRAAAVGRASFSANSRTA